MPRPFGAHMSIAGGHDRAARAAFAVGATAFQVFTKSVNQWNAAPLTEAHARAFRDARRETGIDRVVAHTSYLINLGSPDDDLWERSIAALVVELERCASLEIPDLVMHPGAHMGLGEESGLRRVAAGIDEAFRRARGNPVRLDLETTAGQGSCLGHRIEHLETLLKMVAEPERLGVCCDTCHLFAAGYDLGGPGCHEALVAELDRRVGLERVRVWHVNDSAKPAASRVDRHAGLGRGRMGLAPFWDLVNDPRFEDVPLILETPKGIEGGEDLDAINLRILRGLIGAPRPDDEAFALEPAPKPARGSPKSDAETAKTKSTAKSNAKANPSPSPNAKSNASQPKSARRRPGRAAESESESAP